MPLLLTAALGVLLVVIVPLAAGDSERQLKAEVYVSRTEAAEGDELTFWIWIHPLKQEARRLVVTEAPLDGLTVNSSHAPSSCLQTGRTWVCVRDNNSPFSIEVRAIVEANTSGRDLAYGADVKVWRNDDSDDDDDDESADEIRLSTKVHVLPADIVEEPPKVEVRLIAGQATIVPGRELNYRVQVTNSGTLEARDVSVTVAVPTDLVLTSAYPVWPSRQDDMLTWLLEWVPTGSLDLLFNATLPASSALEEVELGIVATYGNETGQSVRVESAPEHVAVLPLPPAPGASRVPAGVALAVIAFVVRSVVLPRGPIGTWMGLGADEVFLLHRSGVLLKHVSSRRAREMDTDILGGMLAAVRMFVEDSMDPAAGPLQEIRFGAGSIVFVTGKNAALAAVNAQGNRIRFGERAMGLLQEFEARNAEALANFDGLPAPLKGVDSLLGRVAG